MQTEVKSIINRYINVFYFLCVVLLSSCSLLDINTAYRSHQLQDNTLVIQSTFGEVRIAGLPGEAIEVQRLEFGVDQLPSFAKQESLLSITPQIREEKSTVSLTNGNLTAIIKKSDLSVSFYRGSNLLTKQKKYHNKHNRYSFNFTLGPTEKIMGGGERVLGMDRRGHRLPLYNRAHYGYTTESKQMYFSLPVIMSDKKYVILFDNSASGFLDIGETEKNTLSFSAVGGRTAYIVFSGDNYPKLINNYVDVTGKQPLPPRWAFGNYASRFGYRTEREVRETVDKFFAEDFPLDAIILDLYWFGPDIKGHVGNLAWDNNAFPAPVKMIDDLKHKGVKTILVTEPFILSTSSNWQQAVNNKILVKDNKGEPRRFDFYFGNTGLIDIFDNKAQNWFWDIYKGLFAQGVAGTWGDLGEPEVHPDDAIHYISAAEKAARGDAVHNAYGHQWAKMVYENQLKLQPNKRPFIMMRSGFAGSQRFGMIPWTGDVSRSWDGLKPQVELSLQMGLLGMAYTHSDLGGFAGGETFDKEMYIRWLQYGVFQPVYRPHAQDHIPSEPIFHDRETKDIIREFIKLRYRLLPYNYTLAYQNSTSGMPLMRPLFFEDESNRQLLENKDTYLWGSAFLVSPITSPDETEHLTTLPEGVWFDFWSDKRYNGGGNVNIPVTTKTIPVLVRAGAFVPMINDIKSTHYYSGSQLTLHYYADKSVASSYGEMYEDDGESYGTINSKAYELLKFSSKQQGNQLDIVFNSEGQGYRGMPESRQVTVLIHSWDNNPSQISFNRKKLPESAYRYDANTKQLAVSFELKQKAAELRIQ